jgi:hypothetical protein
VTMYFRNHRISNQATKQVRRLNFAVFGFKMFTFEVSLSLSVTESVLFSTTSL